MNGKVIRRLDGQCKSDAATGWIVGLLQDRAACSPLLPTHPRRNIQIDIDAILRAQIGADPIIRRELRKGSRATGPSVIFVPTVLRVGNQADVTLSGGDMVVGIVERRAILQDRLNS